MIIKNLCKCCREIFKRDECPRCNSNAYDRIIIVRELMEELNET